MPWYVQGATVLQLSFLTFHRTLYPEWQGSSADPTLFGAATGLACVLPE